MSDIPGIRHTGCMPTAYRIVLVLNQRLQTCCMYSQLLLVPDLPKCKLLLADVPGHDAGSGCIDGLAQLDRTMIKSDHFACRHTL